MAWSAIVHSAIGTRHQQKQLPCQDYGSYLLQSDTIIGAIADGAGSAKHADIGAQLAVKTALATLNQWSDPWSAVDGHVMAEEAQSLFTDLLQVVLAALEIEAETGEYRLQELGCTLLSFIATPHWLACMQIGDGFIVTQGEQMDTFDLLFEPIKGEFINETVFVTSESALEYMQVAVRTQPYPFVCAATDGLEKVAIRFQDWQPFAPFFNPFLQCLRSVPDAADRQAYLETFLESERLNTRTDDDKTLLLCLYGQEAEG